MEDSFNKDILKACHKAADDLTGIQNLSVIRHIAQQIAGSCTSDMLQINNYPIIVVKTRGAQFGNTNDKINFVKEKVKGSVFESDFNKMFGDPRARSHEKVIFDSPMLSFEKPEDKTWFYNHYMMFTVPVWMFMAHNRALQEKYQVVLDEEDEQSMDYFANYNISKQGGVMNLFSGLKKESYGNLSKSMIKMTEEIASVFGSNLFYFTAIGHKSKNPLPLDKDGYAGITQDQIGVDLEFYLHILEKTPRYASMYSWKYDQQVIKDILVRHNSHDGTFTNLQSGTISHEEISQFMGLYNL